MGIISLLLSSALLLSGCSDDSATSENYSSATLSASPSDAAPGLPAPQFAHDETVELPVAFVSPAGLQEADPLDDQGRPINPERSTEESQQQLLGAAPHQNEIARSGVFGCSDTLSVIRTVPVATDDPVASALNYLLDTETSTHGDPPMTNALAASPAGIIDSISHDGDSVTVELNQAPVMTDSCQAEQVIAQLKVTARSAAGADSAEILVEGTPLHELWGLPEEPALSLVTVNR